MIEKDEYDITNINLTDDTYTIEQSYIRNKYEVTDSDGTVVLRGKQEMFNIKERFPFVTGDGTDAFTVKSPSMIDALGIYTLVDGDTQDEVVVIDEDFSGFTEKWNIRDPENSDVRDAEISARDQDGGILETIARDEISARDPYGDILATIESKGKWAPIARSVVPYANLIPSTYEIRDADGNSIGEITGKLSINDTYSVSLNDTHDTPTGAVIASACIIDALQNN